MSGVGEAILVTAAAVETTSFVGQGIAWVHNRLNPMAVARTTNEMYGQLTPLADRAARAGVPSSEINVAMDNAHTAVGNSVREDSIDERLKVAGKSSGWQSFKAYRYSVSARSAVNRSQNELIFATSKKEIANLHQELGRTRTDRNGWVDTAQLRGTGPASDRTENEATPPERDQPQNISHGRSEGSVLASEPGPSSSASRHEGSTNLPTKEEPASKDTQRPSRRGRTTVLRFADHAGRINILGDREPKPPTSTSGSGTDKQKGAKIGGTPWPSGARKWKTQVA